MDSNQDSRFYIFLDGNQTFQEECQCLFACFDLLEEHHVKAFEKFLASPFLVSNQRLGILFEALYQPYRQEAYYLQGDRLLNKLFGRSDLRRDSRKLKQDFKELEKCLYRFHAYQFLKSEPVEEYRLMAERFRNSNKPAAFANAIKGWKKALDKKPVGTTYYLYHWLLAHYCYFTIDTPKTPKLSHHFESAQYYFEHLQDFVESIYENEKISWQQIYDQPGFRRCAHSDEPAFNTLLTSLYRRLLELRQHSQFQPEIFRQLKNLLLEQQGQLDLIHHFVVWQLMMNYVVKLNRKYNSRYKEELLFLLNYQIENKVFAIFEVIPRELFLNNINTALVNGETELAQAILDELSPRLSAQERFHAVAHAEIAIRFYQQEYQEVIKKLRAYFDRHQMDAFHDGLRLKSYRLRSALALVSKSWDHDDEYEQAFADFEKFLTRKRGKLADSQYLYFHPFLMFIRRIYRSFSSEHQNKTLQGIKKQLLSNQKMHGNQWMINFIDHLLANRAERLAW